jgi:hypothetical protein
MCALVQAGRTQRELLSIGAAMRFAPALLVLALSSPASFAQRIANPPTRMYDHVAQSTYLLDQCGELTPARKEWLLHLLGHAKKRTDWSDAQWAEHDALITADLVRRYPRPPSKEQCLEFGKLIDAERKTTIRD